MVHDQCRRTLFGHDLEGLAELYPVLFGLEQIKELAALLKVRTRRVAE